ncbi:hypothetical protein [Natrinema thermotolerans]|uniref:hypothetical protein n=1 Tax=Natrinema thermotolerans TaxID=121872 RepID=UPI00067914CC|nr:hypothetical protein [Natrinema thermotolerans]QCC57288.1 hypothetical protein DVR14_01020 [Natrinema thermotolerans]
MGDEPVDDRDEVKTDVSVKVKESTLEDLERMFPDALNDPERIRQAIGVARDVCEASSVTVDRDDKTE